MCLTEDKSLNDVYLMRASLHLTTPPNGRNKPEGVSRYLLEIVRDDSGFLRRFQAEGY
jgi:hypothetical protein